MSKRILKKSERDKRGCNDCANMIRTELGNGVTHTCPYEECPYHELDKYNTYEECLNSEDSKIKNFPSFPLSL